MFTRIVGITLSLAAWVTLGACASSADYIAAADAEDYGYYSRKIAENRYRVNFNGNRHTTYEEARDYALLRAAELTVAEGYDWFEIVDRETVTTETGRRPEPNAAFGYEETRTVRDECGLLGCRRTARPATWTTTRLTFDTERPDTRHLHSLEILMGSGDEPEDGHAFNARDVMKWIYDNE